MKLTTQTQVTVDGVMQGNGGASDEDRRSGFERGGWALGAGDDATMAFITETYQRADAFLFGRRTYDIFAPYWGAMDRGGHPIADALNTTPKYLASTTITDPRWADTTVLSADLAAAIGELKAKPGGELQVHGSGSLVRWLLDHGLVDEIQLIIVPVVLGQGTRLFPDAGPDIALDLIDSRADSKGVTIQVYRPAGRPRYPALVVQPPRVGSLGRGSCPRGTRGWIGHAPATPAALSRPPTLSPFAQGVCGPLTVKRPSRRPLIERSDRWRRRGEPRPLARCLVIGLVILDHPVAGWLPGAPHPPHPRLLSRTRSRRALLGRTRARSATRCKNITGAKRQERDGESRRGYHDTRHQDGGGVRFAGVSLGRHTHTDRRRIMVLQSNFRDRS